MASQAAGVCYRLYTRLDFDTRAQETSPEIQRADLASALLQLMAWGQNPLQFDYLDQPERFSRESVVGKVRSSSPLTFAAPRQSSNRSAN